MMLRRTPIPLPDRRANVRPDVSDRRATPRHTALSPLHKRALGTAFAATAALAVFLITAYEILFGPHDGIDLLLLRAYFAGYSVTWTGAVIGAAWGGFSGFVLGWFVAFARNFILAVAIVVVRARAELIQTRDFLDHI